MITFKNVTLRRGKNVLLREINWTIYHQQRIGFIGANGTGKSSLFALLLRELQPEDGEIELPKQLKLGHVAQETPALQISSLDFVMSGDHELQHLLEELKIAEEAHDAERQANLHEKLGIIDGYTAEARAAQLLSGLGFPYADQHKMVSEFSGGWRVRLNLAKALMARSDILLLDEPTNHLDLDAVLWLEEWLSHYQGTLLIVSHDRDFLDRIVDHIAYVANQQLKIYTGNYSTFERAYASSLLVQQATYEKQQRQLAHLESFVNRFRAKASKARQAQSRLKAIERMELVCAVQAESPFHFEFRKPDECPYPLIKLDHASITYGEKNVLKNISLSLIPNQRVAILGPNGAGKSSLIKLLAGEIEPTTGIREASSGLKIGYFAQHQVDHLQLDETPLVLLKRLAPHTQELDLRKYLGSFDFSGDRVFEQVKNFSGGEKSRLALALLIWQKPNLLLLDVPTNHLDLEMRNALSLALQEYEGAMLSVSHDRFLVRTTADQLWLVADGKVDMFDGDLSDYQTWLVNYRKQQMQGILKKEPKKQTGDDREQLKPIMQTIKQLESSIDKAELKMTSVELQLADESLYEPANKDKLKKVLAEQAELKNQLTHFEEQWLAACEQRDQLLVK